jgi:putative hydrolase of the HAD superfamily
MYHHKKHLFFDLDHTLWDYERACTETLSRLYQKHNMAAMGVPSIEVLNRRFTEINSALWHEYDSYRITSEQLRVRRFQEIMQHFGEFKIEFTNTLNSDYLAISPFMPYLINGAMDLLHYLQPKYHLHIITNGFVEIQQTKLQSAQILPFFKEIITSEQAHAKKPEAQIFAHALSVTNCSLSEALMIGDNVKTDIQGAKNAGMDYVHFNPDLENFEKGEKSVVKHLSDLKQIL